MQAKLPNDDELFDDISDEVNGEFERTDVQYDDITNQYDDEPFDEPPIEPFEPIERIQSAFAQVSSMVGRGLRAAWSRLVPTVLDTDDDWEDPGDDDPDDEPTDIVDEDDDPIMVIDATDDHYIEQQDARPAPMPLRPREVPAAPQLPPVYTDHLITGKRRRPTTIHTHITQRVEPDHGPAPQTLASPYNELSWDSNRAILTVSEPVWEEWNQDDPHPARRRRSVELAIHTFDERIVPVLLGVINAIDGNAEPSGEWINELPYVCESGQNTFCWYRQNRQLKIFWQRHMDDKGLVRSSRCVVLNAGALPLDAKPLFQEILNLRAKNNPYRADL
ncbi:hypothetical protein AGMMS49992_08610 [Clostridia bacterium]|nr:hypothetical protein AGMMS49992_08610 [Clostridia bacterium]